MRVPSQSAPSHTAGEAPRAFFFFFSDKIACELNIRKCARLPTTAEPLQRRL